MKKIALSIILIFLLCSSVYAADPSIQISSGGYNAIVSYGTKENNFEELAYETVCAEITMGETPYKASDFPIVVAKRDMPSAAVCI